MMHKLQKKRIGVILGGFSAERHISVESGRNIYEKLASSSDYTPIPIYLAGDADNLIFYLLPINLLFKDNADDIHSYLKNPRTNTPDEPIYVIRQKARKITCKFGSLLQEPREICLEELSSIIDFAFIALHGHPGEDGTLQSLLEKHKIPYNGSGVDASRLAMDKYMTNKALSVQNICLPNQILVPGCDWLAKSYEILTEVETTLGYPLIVKPVNDGCSVGVEKIISRKSLVDYATKFFDSSSDFSTKSFLIEEFICRGDAKHLLEITCGFITHYSESGRLIYEIFSPSETISQSAILTVEEKFLAGDGQNITPARFSPDVIKSSEIEQKVKKEIEKVATVLGLEGYARIDAFVKIDANDQVGVFIIEANSLPGMTAATCIFHQCILNGYRPIEFIHKIIDFGFKKFAIK